MNKLTLDRYRHRVIQFALVTAVLFSFLFGMTVSKQAVHYADASDLLLASTYGGLAHPPGYPLFIWLLHTLIVAFPHVSPSFLGGLLAALCMGIAMGLLVLILTGLVHRINNTRIWLESVLVLLLLWAIIPFNWTLATVPEIMSLALVLALGLFVSGLEPLHIRKRVPRYPVWVGFFGIMAGLFHPLLIGVVAWTWLAWMWVWRTSWKKWVFAWFRGVMAGLLMTGLLYAVIALSASWYSWEIPQSFVDWWLFWSRQVYTDSGSAIETLRHDSTVSHIADGILRWGRWWLVDQSGLVLTLFSIGGLCLVLLKKKISWFILFILPLLMYGPGIAFYLKHPETYPLAETAVWWGVALRERMFYVLPLVVIIPAVLSLAWLETTGRMISKLTRVGLWITLFILGWTTWNIFNNRLMPHANAASEYMTRVLSELPANATLLVDHDDIFGLLYTQSLLAIRRDVVIVPVGMILTPHWWNNSWMHVSKNGFTTNKPLFVTDVVSTVLESNRQIFLYGIDSWVLEQLGVEGNPYYARPHGYVLEILSSPFEVIPAADYGLSVQVAAMKTTNVDSWFKGFRTHLGTIHAGHAYFLARMGFEKEARWHATIAKDLFYRDESKQTVVSILEEGMQRFNTVGSYLYLNK